MSRKPRVFEMKPCLGCGKAIQAQAPSGRCVSCGNVERWKDPAFRERRIAGIRRKHREDPVWHAAQVARARRMGQIAALDPELRARRSERGKRIYREVLCRPDIMAKNLAARKACGPAMTEYHLGWCPPEYRDDYRHLMRAKKMRAVDARAIIETRVADTNAVRSGLLSFAVDYLRRLAPIGRCDPDGKPDAVGTHYRYGSGVLSSGKVIERAKLKGWNPERLAA